MAQKEETGGGTGPIRTREDLFLAAKRFGCDKKEVRELLKEYDESDGLMPIIFLHHTAAVYLEEPQDSDPDEGVYGYEYSDFDS